MVLCENERRTLRSVDVEADMILDRQIVRTSTMTNTYECVNYSRGECAYTVCLRTFFGWFGVALVESLFVTETSNFEEKRRVLVSRYWKAFTGSRTIN